MNSDNKKVQTTEEFIDDKGLKSYIKKYYEDDKLVKTEYYNSKMKKHRDGDLPAIICYGDNILGMKLPDNGKLEIWVQNGKIYRDNNEPPIIGYYGKTDNIYLICCMQNGKIHSIRDLPAIIILRPDGRIKQEVWYKDNELYREGYKPTSISYNRDGTVYKYYKNGVEYNYIPDELIGALMQYYQERTAKLAGC